MYSNEAANLLEAIAEASEILKRGPTGEEARPERVIPGAVRLEVVSLHSPVPGLRIVDSQSVARGVRIERVVLAAVRHLHVRYTYYVILLINHQCRSNCEKFEI